MSQKELNHAQHDDHDENDGHDEKHRGSVSPFRMRLPSPLSPEAEEAMSQTIGCAFRVHRQLGPGFRESIYRRAMYLELTAAGLSYESELPVVVRYRGVELTGQRVDLIVRREIVVELKSV